MLRCSKCHKRILNEDNEDGEYTEDDKGNILCSKCTSKVSEISILRDIEWEAEKIIGKINSQIVKNLKQKIIKYKDLFGETND